MKNITDYKVILWDFDGVIMDSMPIRDRGFAEVLKSYPQDQVRKLMEFHQKNGGLSRYVKFRYFFENIRNESVTEEKIMELSESFSKIMLNLLIDKNLLIHDSIHFIENHHSSNEMHIVSGSDGNELRYICKQLNLSGYFKSINGSPTPKTELVNRLIAEYGYNTKEITLIGDSKNDYDAATKNNIDFLGYNNLNLQNLGRFYISSFKSLKGYEN